MRCIFPPRLRIRQAGIMYLSTPTGALVYFPTELVVFSPVLDQMFSQGLGRNEGSPAPVLCTQVALSVIINDLQRFLNGQDVTVEFYDRSVLEGVASCARSLGISILEDIYQGGLNRRNQQERRRRIEEEERRRQERIDRVERIQREQEEQNRRMEEERQRRLPTRENAYRAIGVTPGATPWDILGVEQNAPFTAIRSAYLRLKGAWEKQVGINPLALLVLQVIEAAYTTLRE